MVYWTLVPKNLSNNVDDVYIKIHSDFKYADTLDIWGYGKYGAPAYVYDGYIEMSAQNLTLSEYMTALIKFPKGSFNLNQKIDKDFSYAVVKYAYTVKRSVQKREETISTVLNEMSSRANSYSAGGGGRSSGGAGGGGIR